MGPQHSRPEERTPQDIQVNSATRSDDHRWMRGMPCLELTKVVWILPLMSVCLCGTLGRHFSVSLIPQPVLEANFAVATVLYLLPVVQLVKVPKVAGVGRGKLGLRLIKRLCITLLRCLSNAPSQVILICLCNQAGFKKKFLTLLGILFLRAKFAPCTGPSGLPVTP